MITMKFGIIGLGNHAINRVMPAIKSSGNSITAIYSRTLKKAEKEGAAYGAVAFSDLDEFFSRGDFDAVYIENCQIEETGNGRERISAGFSNDIVKPCRSDFQSSISIIWGSC